MMSLDLMMIALSLATSVLFLATQVFAAPMARILRIDPRAAITDVDGVDLNRNLAGHWGYDNAGSSPAPASTPHARPPSGRPHVGLRLSRVGIVREARRPTRQRRIGELYGDIEQKTSDLEQKTLQPPGKPFGYALDPVWRIMTR